MSGVTSRKLPVALAVCVQIAFASAALAGQHDELIAKHSAANGVPEHLVRRVILIESRGNASAVHAGNYGLMQIRLGTARGVGYLGEANGLLDPETNLTYAVKYLAGAYRAAGCNADRAVSYYQRGYYGAPRSQCSSAAPALIEVVAEAESKSAKAAARKRGQAATPVNDVIKPKIVRTETIASSKLDQVPARPLGNFEPARIALPPVKPLVADESSKWQALGTPGSASLKSDSLKSDSLKLVPAAPAAQFELASVPLPPVRPEPVVTPKREAKHAQRVGRTTIVTARTSKSDEPAVLSFIKKLVTPDPKSVRHQSEAEAEWFPPVQSPQ